jgi:DNA-binding MarR family transcriptional regulator
MQLFSKGDIMDNHTETCTAQFFRIIDKVLLMKKNNTITIEKGLKLYPSEIHLILLIRNEQIGNYSSIVQNLEITKGAVSQTISRLVKKGIVEKIRSGSNNNDLTIRLTPLGLKVQIECKEIQASFMNQVSSYFISLSQNDREIIGKFLTHIEANMNISDQIDQFQ